MRPVIMSFLVWLLLVLIVIGSSAPAPAARLLHVTGTLPPTNTPRPTRTAIILSSTKH